MNVEHLQSSVLGCQTIVCRLGAVVAFANGSDSHKCGENADRGKQVSQRLQLGSQHLEAESMCVPVLLQILVWPSTTRSFIIRMTAARIRSFNRSQTFLTDYIAPKSCNVGVNLTLLTTLC